MRNIEKYSVKFYSCLDLHNQFKLCNAYGYNGYEVYRVHIMLKTITCQCGSCVCQTIFGNDKILFDGIHVVEFYKGLSIEDKMRIIDICNTINEKK